MTESKLKRGNEIKEEIKAKKEHLADIKESFHKANEHKNIGELVYMSARCIDVAFYLEIEDVTKTLSEKIDSLTNEIGRLEKEFISL